MIRWKNTTGRWILVAIATLGIWGLANPFREGNFLRRCESITGSDVVVGSVHSSIRSQTIQITDLQIGDPHEPSRNLLQADAALLSFDRSRLWHRELVIDRGTLRNLQLGVLRKANQSVSTTSKSDIQWRAADWSAELADLGTQFICELKLPEFDPNRHAVEITRVAQATRMNLTSLFELNKSKAHNLLTRLAEMQTTLQDPGPNPLRNAERSSSLNSSVQALRDDWTKANENLDSLRTSIEESRLALREARDADSQAIRQKEYKVNIDSQLLSKILVGPSQTDRIDEIMHWIRWLRVAAPNYDKDLMPTRCRGVDVRFLTALQPDFLIRSLDFDGTGPFGGQSLAFAGHASNVTLQPSLLSQPCVIEVQSQGSNPTRITAELDRRTKENIDRIKIECAGVQQSGQTLGDRNCLLVDVSPTRMSLIADLRLYGDTIEGTVKVTHADAAMRMGFVSPAIGSAEFRDSMNRELASLNKFSSEIRLSGKLNDVRLDVTSDLGPNLSGPAMQNAESRAKSAIQGNLAQLQQRYQSELASLNGAFQNSLEEIAELLQSNETRIAELDQLVPTPDGLNRIR